jgi:DNA-directed RNA polymerase specialized sigma24 family protein
VLRAHAVKALARYPFVKAQLDAEDLVQEAYASMLAWEAAEPGRRADNLRAFLTRCITHRVHSEARKGRREVGSDDPPEAEADGPAADQRLADARGEGKDALRQRIHVVREALDGVARQPERKRRHHGTLLVVLRLTVLHRVEVALREDMSGAQDRRVLVRTAERAVPWREEEGAAPLKVGVDLAAGALWSAIASRFRETGRVPDGAEQCELASRLAGAPGGGIAPDLWYQWKGRAKREARDAVGEETWRRVFACWLPDRSVRRRAGKEG